MFAAFQAAATPALMTVFRNEGRWDTSNVIFDGRMVTLYDKQRRARPADEFAFIDYGLLGAGAPGDRRRGPGRRARPTWPGCSSISACAAQLAGMEVHERFYEIGSPVGLEDFAGWLRRRP